MKKGFTLIELLAVILILGIIALIAIPTVNKILDEARYGAFKASANNVIKLTEETCQTQIIKNENPTLTYSFNGGNVSSNLDIKGTLPDDGYIILNNDCGVDEFYLTSNKYVYTNVSDENLVSNYMLKAPINSWESLFKTLYSDYYNNLISINFVKNLDIPGNAIEIKDPSESQNGKVKSWLVPNGSSYDLYIGSLNKIYANYNSSYLLSNSSATSLNVENLYTDFTTNFKSFLEYSKFIVLDLNNLKTDNATNFNYIFSASYSLVSLNVKDWNTSKVTNMEGAFYSCQSLSIIDISNWDTSKVSNMIIMFNDCLSLREVRGIEKIKFNSTNSLYTFFDSCRSLTSIDLSSWDTSRITNISKLFSDDNGFGDEMKLENINLSNWNLKNVTSYENVFYNNNATKNIIMKNSDYTSINLIINVMPNRVSKEAGVIDITGVDDISGVNISAAESKNWTIIS